MSEPSPIQPNSAVLSKRSNKTMALLLIIAGAVIFLSNSGPLGFVIWHVVFPIALLGIGLDLVTEGRERRRIGIAALVATVVFAPLIGGAQFVERERSPERASGSSHNQIGTIENIERVQAHINLTAGDLSVEALDDESDAIAALDGEGEPERNVERNGETAVVRVDKPLAGDIDLQLTQRVPVELNIVMGVGSIEPLDLETIQLTKLVLQLTTGDVDLKLPGQGVMDVDISNELGDVDIEIPEGLAVQIEAESSIGNVEVDERFKLQNGVYVTDNYSEDAPNRATIRISKSLGNIEIH